MNIWLMGAAAGVSIHSIKWSHIVVGGVKITDSQIDWILILGISIVRKGKGSVVMSMDVGGTLILIVEVGMT